ncbi:MAG: prolipoprotein diacylglyceryl transferase, partial [Lachnospiraceae bacterium]|nr:prolipoprotein diacylglyceryl transferase [Lachnospiraceae bacterium]
HEITESISQHITEGINYIQVHPTFLYESLWNFSLFLLIQLYKKHKRFDGEITLFYLGGYGLGRFWIEALRTDQLLLPQTNIPVSRLLAGILFLVAFGAEIFMLWKHQKKAA